jgi:hypothetical protein
MAPELMRMVANFWISRKLRLASASVPPAAAVRNSRPPPWPNAGRRRGAAKEYFLTIASEFVGHADRVYPHSGRA